MHPRNQKIVEYIKKHSGQYTSTELAQHFGVTKNVIWQLTNRNFLQPHIKPPEAGGILSSSTLKLEATMPKTKKELVEETRLEAQLRRAKEELAERDKKIKILTKELNDTQTAFDEALGVTKRQPKPFQITAAKDGEKKQATAVALLSDVHCEEIIASSKVNYLNKHNPDISKKRVTRFFQLLVKFIRLHRRDSDITTLVLWLGGDFFTGSESHGTPVAFGDSMAVMFAQDMLVSGIRFICEQEPNLRIHIVGSVGNHSRKNQTKPVNVATEQELSLEWVMYHSLKQVFADNKNLTFQLDNSYHSYVKVYNKTIRFNHGHLGFRYNKGLAGIHGPLWKTISETWDNQIAADLTCIGHYHTWTPASLARPYMVNGSTVGLSPYGSHFGYEPPAQMMFLVHQRYGFIEQTPLFVEA